MLNRKVKLFYVKILILKLENNSGLSNVKKITKFERKQRILRRVFFRKCARTPLLENNFSNDYIQTTRALFKFCF